ncbi:MAG: GntR family transcriptional regulator [Pseudonocardia sp.]
MADVEERIDSGTLRPGDLLDSESALTARYEVSRGTVRTALVKLAEGGRIESVPGKGWFVCVVNEPDRAGGKPDVPAVVVELRNELQSGSYRDGDLFMSEKDLCERFGLTRYGARRAFAALEADGLVVAVHGRGRFVSLG